MKQEFGSQQLRKFRIARRDGASIADAAQIAGIGIGEATLHAAEDDANPPPPAAFELLGQSKGADMASPAVKDDEHDNGGEVPQMDFEGAVRTWRQDIKPAVSKQGDHAQEASTGYKHIKKNCHIQPAAAKLAFKLDGMEEAMRDDFLRGLNGLLKELKIFMPRDLMDLAEGKDGHEDVIPTGERARPQLVTVGDDFEASEEELAKQTERKPRKPSFDASKIKSAPLPPHDGDNTDLAGEDGDETED